MTAKSKIRIATTSLAGCFGCHMSFLDMDERLVALLEQVELNRSPFTDIKQCGPCDIGLIEGGVCNAENVHVLRDFRAHCTILIAVGACAINGGVPAMRNYFDLQDCLQEVYLNGTGVTNPQIPSDIELPLLLDKVYPVSEVVPIDYFLPGCPPSADEFLQILEPLLTGHKPELPKSHVHYD
ncbi:MAG TPA: NADP oxidoreductase [Nitrosomonas sp.]|jgi:NAD-reducing hydrogenase small subunit|nr:NADP oxidoreductase [Nitrosomonas sp.]MBP6354286.1 NADP oxidoreductase [Nitrosomonas sp.]MBP9871079.1 NADP oxidoreductase [Nitrosomonas sp.]HQV89036.1 NADP oxidoreductase [Nitrosomonas sp.]HRB96486.1 NADP oxidoreductase [Nitrosomonas sp.]